MPNYSEIVKELNESNFKFDLVLQKYFDKLYKIRKRNMIFYYSGFVHKDRLSQHFAISARDMDAFMNVAYSLDRKEGLDLVLHTPGGDTATTEAIGNYLRGLFGDDIEVFVPQIAMSGGTLLSLVGRSIHMGLHSSLGPIDPQLGNIAVGGVLDEFKFALDGARKDKLRAIPFYLEILRKYPPTLVGTSRNLMKWVRDIAEDWLSSNMLKDDSKAIDKIIKELTHYESVKSHGRKLSYKFCSDLGLKVSPLESDKDLQDTVLSIHHIFCALFQFQEGVDKVTANHLGTRYISNTNVRSQPSR